MNNSDLKLRNFYTTFINPHTVKNFVRNKLGCKCEESVFKQIVIGMPSIFSEDNPACDMQIIVGFRLFISFVSVNKLKPTIEDVVKLLKLGQQIRDKHNLNRFRLVLMGHLDKELYEICQIKAQEFDERIHIHVIEV